MRQCGENPDQVLFQDILIRLRNAETTIADWQCLMQRTPTRVTNLSSFASALYLYGTLQLKLYLSTTRPSFKPVVNPLPVLTLCIVVQMHQRRR